MGRAREVKIRRNKTRERRRHTLSRPLFNQAQAPPPSRLPPLSQGSSPSIKTSPPPSRLLSFHRGSSVETPRPPSSRKAGMVLRLQYHYLFTYFYSNLNFEYLFFSFSFSFFLVYFDPAVAGEILFLVSWRWKSAATFCSDSLPPSLRRGSSPQPGLLPLRRRGSAPSVEAPLPPSRLLSLRRGFSPPSKLSSFKLSLGRSSLGGGGSLSGNLGPSFF